MFYFDKINGKDVLKSDLLTDIQHCFTTRGISPADVTDVPLLTPIQTHSDNVRIANTETEYANTDSLIISHKNIAVYLKFADCTPIIFYDPIKRIGAVTHAGWRGTAKRIGVKTVQKMQSEFDSKPSDIIAIIGPAIGLCCYEVSEDVKKNLIKTVKNSEGLFIGNNVDLKGINARQLQEIGIEQTDICPYCTSCNNNLFYSYRKENGTDKRHYAILQMA